MRAPANTPSQLRGNFPDAPKTKEEQEEQLLHQRYKELCTSARAATRSKKEKAKIEEAFQIALESHKGIRRRSGELFMHHLLNVAHIVAEEIGLGSTSIICALLHDVVEDTEFPIEEIEKRLGSKVAKIIKGLTKLSQDKFEWGTSKQAENLRKLLLTFSEDMRIILIKLADRLDNMRSLDSMPRQKQLKIAAETKYLYVPLAHRLGLNQIKTELEDLYLKYTHTDSYYDIVQKLHITKEERELFMQDFAKPIHRTLRKKGFKFKLKKRTKSIFSIWSKMQNKNVPFEQIYDLIALRIILKGDTDDEKALCWQAYSAITDIYKPNPDRLRDWISRPKSNGYESLHITLMSHTGQWVEVQIRTQRMDEIAERGYAAHWNYKEQIASTQISTLDNWLNEVRNLLHQDKTSAIKFIDEFKFALYSDEIYVYTPKGSLRILPQGASVLDFAFSIHTEMGLHCASAKVNHLPASIDQRLKNGDQVEIIPSSQLQANDHWLDFVVSSKARRNIQQALKEQQHIAERDGRDLLQTQLKKKKITLNTKILEQIRELCHENTIDEVYYKIGKQIKSPEKVVKELVDTICMTTNQETEAPPGKPFIIKKEEENNTYTLSKCCTPIPGDEVFGLHSASKKIKIHRSECPNALTLLTHHGHHSIKARWDFQEKASLARLLIKGHQQMNLANLMGIIAQGHRVKILSATFDANEASSKGKLMISLYNAKQLNELMQNIKNIEGVTSIKRLPAG